MPAPAPIVSMAMVGTFSLKRSMIGSFSMRTWPWVMTPMSKLVPPMSETMMLSVPMVSPTCLAPRMPPMGPEIMVS